MRRTGTLAVLLLVAAGRLPAADRTWDVDPKHSEVGFLIAHMIGKVRGRFTKFTGQIQGDLAHPEGASIELAIKAATISTGLPRRDDHLRGPDFFDVAAHPDITFRSERISAKGKDLYLAQGWLSMHGVSKSISVPVRLLRTDLGAAGVQRVRFSIDTTIDRREWGIVWNKTLESGGLLLGDEVTIDIELEASARP
jgi:polyisoprenoid-binding protein YceI